MNLFSRTDKSFLGQWWWTVDRGLLGAFLILAVFGVVLVTTASPPVANLLGLGYYHFLTRHVIILVPSLLMLVGISMLDRRSVWRLSTLAFVGSVVAMILVLFVGAEIKGATRWIHVLGFSLQPSEFVKPAFLVVSAWLMAKQASKGQGANTRAGSYMSAGLYLLVVVLLLLQPDMGMTFLLTCAWGAQIFLAGFPLRLLFAFAGVGIAGLFGSYMFFPHFQSRIDRFLNPESGDTYQIQKSIEAFQSAGYWGAGPGQGSVKYHLPDAHADFIFSVAGEELGLIFVLVLMFVFGFIIWRGFSRLMDGEDMFAVLCVGGLLTMFGLQSMVHMGSALNVLPTKGMTLPFISYGGSSLLSMGYAMGVVLALTRRQVRSGIARGGLSLSAGGAKTAGDKA